MNRAFGTFPIAWNGTIYQWLLFPPDQFYSTWEGKWDGEKYFVEYMTLVLRLPRRIPVHQIKDEFQTMQQANLQWLLEYSQTSWLGWEESCHLLHYTKRESLIQLFLGAEDFHSFFYLGSVFGLNHRGQFFHPFFKPHLRITFFSISKISFRKKVEKFKRGNQWHGLVTYFLQHETCCQGENVHWTNECTDAMDTFDDDIDYKWLHTRIK